MATVQLDIPYKSQWDGDAKDHSADCGPTSLAMIFGALGKPVGPDHLYTHIGQRGYSQYTSFGDLKRAAHGYGQLEMTRKNFLPHSAVDELKATINSGRPFIALANYAFWDPIVKNNFRGSHFVVVSGYSDTHIFVHDPLFKGDRRDQGAFFPFTHKQFIDGWGGFANNINPNYAVLIAEAQVPFRGNAAQPAAQPITTGAGVDPTLQRHIMAKAAFYGEPYPNFNDPAAVKTATDKLGDFGKSWDTYTIRRGDSLVNIARMFYFDGDKYPVIAFFNGLQDPNQIEFGDVLLVPRVELNEMTDATVALPGFGGPNP